MAQRCQLQSRQHTVAAQAMGRREDVSGLLTAEGRTTGHHGGMNVLVSDGGAFQQTSAPLPGPLESKVGHHRGDQALLRQSLLFLQNRAPQKQDVITVHNTALAINGKHPVRITIKRKSHGRATLLHRLTQRLQLG